MSNGPVFNFLVYLFVFNGVLWGLHYFVYRNLVRLLAGSATLGTPRARRWIAVLFIAMDVPWAFLYFYRQITGDIPNAAGWLLMYPFAVWQATLFFWVMVLLVTRAVTGTRRLGRWIVARVRPDPPMEAVPVAPANKSRRMFLRTSTIGLTAYAAGSATGGVIGRDEYEVNMREIVIPGLPAAFNDFSIALISDIHSGVFLEKDEMEHYAQVVNDLRADMIVLPGDFVTSLDKEIHPFAEAFSQLRAPSGVFGCTGNHDHFAHIDFITREAEQAGIRILRNESVAVQKGDAKIHLLGIDDDVVGRHEPERFVQTGKSAPVESMMQGVPADDVKVLLCHRPYPFESFSQMNVDLMLSGHTHGGQISLLNMGGINLSFAAIASKYIQGHYRSESNFRSQMYVSRGIGTVGLPIRVNCPPEVTKIVLRQERKGMA